MTLENRTDPAKEPETPLLRDILYALRYYLGGRRMLIAAALAVVAGGLLLNWSWLVAVGMAPLLLAVLPCAALCALGIGMLGTQTNPGKGKDVADATGDEPDDTNRP